MAEKATIARPYARAAFDYARAQDGFAQWSGALAAAAKVVSDPRVAPLLSNPRVRSGQLVDLISEAAGAVAPGPAHNFLRLLAENHRLGLLPEIAVQYEVLRMEAEKVVDVEVVCAMGMDDAQKTRLARALQGRLGREVRMHTRIDASLIGGAIVRAGDLVIDGSLKGRLQRLASEMTA
jgi:F-type H+-transporting ATPase subunit delta